MLGFRQFSELNAGSLPTSVSTHQNDRDPKTNRHCLPLFSLQEGYRQFLMSGLGEMVFRTLSGLVNDWRETVEFDLIRLWLRLFAERLRLFGVLLKSGDHSPPVTGQRWNNVAAYQGIHFLR
jgi:hypothetical protein